MTFDFKEKVVLITGGAGGIGLACITELLKNGLKGVVIADTDTNAAIKAVSVLGEDRVVYVKTDVTNAAEFENAFKETINIFQSLDIVVNCAGLAKDDCWELTINVNAKSVVTGTLLGFKYMRKDKGGNGGTIINVASILGIKYLPGLPVYTATKHFNIAFSRCIGTSFYKNLTGVSVVCICPSSTNTNILSNGTSLPDFEGLMQEAVKQMINLGKVQTPEHVAKELINILKYAENGSAWIIAAGEKSYEAKIPSELLLSCL